MSTDISYIFHKVVPYWKKNIIQLRKNMNFQQDDSIVSLYSRVCMGGPAQGQWCEYKFS